MADLTDQARHLRANLTQAERRLWSALRRQALGARFRRQVPLGPYVVDFACPTRRLVVEVDGGQHLENPADVQRDAWLQANGFRVLRFWNHEVLANLEGVLTVILAALGGGSDGAAPPS